MKKTIIVLLAFCASFTVSLNAQTKLKLGHMNSGEVMKVMPGIDSIQIKLIEFQNQLKGEYEQMMMEYQKKREDFETKGGTMSQSVYQIKAQEIKDLEARITEFAKSAEEDVQDKYTELLHPFQEKLLNAIKEVSKENGYTYIFDSTQGGALLYSENSDDIAPLVKKKLGIQ